MAEKEEVVDVGTGEDEGEFHNKVRQTLAGRGGREQRGSAEVPATKGHGAAPGRAGARSGGVRVSACLRAGRGPISSRGTAPSAELALDAGLVAQQKRVNFVKSEGLTTAGEQR